MDIATIIGAVAAVLLILYTAQFDFGPGMFGNIPSYATVVGVTIGMMLVSFTVRDINRLPRYIMYAFKPPKADADRSEVINDLEKGILMLSRLKTYALATGWIGTLIGAVIILKNLGDPAKLGPVISLCLLTVLYGTIIAYVFCLPFSTKLQVQLDEWKKM